MFKIVLADGTRCSTWATNSANFIIGTYLSNNAIFPIEFDRGGTKFGLTSRTIRS